MSESIGYPGPLSLEELKQTSNRLRLPFDHPAVLQHSLAMAELRSAHEENSMLRLELESAQKDPLTGFLLKGPGFRQLEQLMSEVENNLAGLGTDGPNALLVIGLDVEGLHYTNNWYGQKGGDERIFSAGSELRGVAEIVRNSTRTRDRRNNAREGSAVRKPDLLIRIGGDELLAAMLFHETDENSKQMMADRVVQRLARRKLEEAPKLRILYKVGFFVPGIGQTPEDLYNSVDPKAEMSRRQKLARPIFKVIRASLGHYGPPDSGQL